MPPSGPRLPRMPLRLRLLLVRGAALEGPRQPPALAQARGAAPGLRLHLHTAEMKAKTAQTTTTPHQRSLPLTSSTSPTT